MKPGAPGHPALSVSVGNGRPEVSYDGIVGGWQARHWSLGTALVVGILVAAGAFHYGKGCGRADQQARPGAQRPQGMDAAPGIGDGASADTPVDATAEPCPPVHFPDATPVGLAETALDFVTNRGRNDLAACPSRAHVHVDPRGPGLEACWASDRDGLQTADVTWTVPSGDRSTTRFRREESGWRAGATRELDLGLVKRWADALGSMPSLQRLELLRPSETRVARDVVDGGDPPPCTPFPDGGEDATWARMGALHDGPAPLLCMIEQRLASNPDGGLPVVDPDHEPIVSCFRHPEPAQELVSFDVEVEGCSTGLRGVRYEVRTGSRVDEWQVAADGDVAERVGRRAAAQQHGWPPYWASGQTTPTDGHARVPPTTPVSGAPEPIERSAAPDLIELLLPWRVVAAASDTDPAIVTVSHLARTAQWRLGTDAAVTLVHADRWRALPALGDRVVATQTAEPTVEEEGSLAIATVSGYTASDIGSSFTYRWHFVAPRGHNALALLGSIPVGWHCYDVPWYDLKLLYRPTMRPRGHVTLTRRVAVASRGNAQQPEPTWSHEPLEAPHDLAGRYELTGVGFIPVD